MRVIPKSKRHRIALFYTILAWGGLAAGVTGGALAQRSALSWLLPIFGLAGYIVCARLAMLLWQGRRALPRPPRPRIVLAAGILALAVVHVEAEETILKAPEAAVLENEDASRQKSYKIRGWLQLGFTANFESPEDRINFGVNFNWRSNDYRLNQVNLVLENPLEHESKTNLGYRVDLLVGHDAPFFAANGLFDRFTGFDPTSGFGLDGVPSYRDVDKVGIDLPQFYVDVFIPRFIKGKGVELRIGKFYTLMGREVYPAPDTDFYSRTYENVLGTPFTHTGVLATVHATDTVDVAVGLLQGWDVFEDNNDRPSYQAAVIWNSPDKRCNWTTVWITGPEQADNDDNDRTLVTSYLTVRFGEGDAWLLSTGGHFGRDENAAVDASTGLPADAEWYAYSVHLFHMVDPGVRLGLRAEWFRDDDEARTAVLKRPGFASSFSNVTLGVTYWLRENVRLRPEIRGDWASDARPFNEQTRKSQGTVAFDVILTF